MFGKYKCFTLLCVCTQWCPIKFIRLPNSSKEHIIKLSSSNNINNKIVIILNGDNNIKLLLITNKKLGLNYNNYIMKIFSNRTKWEQEKSERWHT